MGWDEQSLRTAWIDMDWIENWIGGNEAGKHPVLERALASARPADASLTKAREGRSQPSRPDNCAYCANRAKAPDGSPESRPDHPRNYLFGTGDGNHAPSACLPCKLFHVAGGDDRVAPECRPYLAKMVIRNDART